MRFRLLAPAAAACLLVSTAACAVDSRHPLTVPLPVSPPALSRLDAAGVSGGIGWIVGGGNLYLTSDFGRSSWLRVTLPAGAPPQASVAVIDFRTIELAWLPSNGAASVMVARTSTAGADWQTGAVGIRPQMAHSVSLIAGDAAHAWLVVNEQQTMNTYTGELFVTSDGGASWRAGVTGPGAAAVLTPGGRGFAVGVWARNLAQTADGKTWNALPGQPSFGVPVFASATDGAYVAGDGLRTTSDGGATWTGPHPVPWPTSTAGGPAPLLAAGDRGTWYVRTSNPAGLWRSDDGARTWRAVPAKGIGPINQIWFRHDDGWGFAAAVGTCIAKSQCTTRSVLQRTTDGGRTWQPIFE